jgi:hypothetical protein
MVITGQGDKDYRPDGRAPRLVYVPEPGQVRCYPRQVMGHQNIMHSQINDLAISPARWADLMLQRGHV